jgi:hypothetical protein
LYGSLGVSCEGEEENCADLEGDVDSLISLGKSFCGVCWDEIVVSDDSTGKGKMRVRGRKEMVEGI